MNFVVKEVIGPGHAIRDKHPTPKVFRGIPTVVAGVQRTTPTGANQPTGSQVSKIPQPQ